MTRKGFTLIELLVVVIIMGVLTSVALPQYRKAMDRAKVAEALQMLPAIYEARERWMIEHQCTWNGLSYQCADGSTLGFDKLDIESKGKIDKDDPGLLITSNFSYYLLTHQCGNGSKNRRQVSASPAWGESRHIPAVSFCYGGNKVCCVDLGWNLCASLNVDKCE